MASMSYCRWHNLVHELRACRDVLETRLEDRDRWDGENAKRENALRLMADILEAWGVEQLPNGRLKVAERDNADLPEEDDEG